MKLFDEIRLKGFILLEMAAASNKMSLFFSRKVFAGINFANKSVFAIRIVLGPPILAFALQSFTHCKTSHAGLLLQNHLKPIFNSAFDKELTVEKKRVGARTKNTFVLCKRSFGLV